MMCFRKPRVTVFSKNDCVQCERTAWYLDREGVGFEVRNMEEDAEALAFVKDLGYKQAPVVIARYPDGSEAHWSGFRPDKLSGYAAVAARWVSDEVGN